MSNFHVNFSHWWLVYLLWNCHQVNVTGLHWWSVNIGSGNGLVPWGNKPLSEPMLTQISCRHMASLGHNKLMAVPRKKQWKPGNDHEGVTDDNHVIMRRLSHKHYMMKSLQHNSILNHHHLHQVHQFLQTNNRRSLKLHILTLCEQNRVAGGFP